MSFFFKIPENNHNKRHFQDLSNERRRTVNHGLEAICNRVPFLSANPLPEYKLACS